MDDLAAVGQATLTSLARAGENTLSFLLGGDQPARSTPRRRIGLDSADGVGSDDVFSRATPSPDEKNLRRGSSAGKEGRREEMARKWLSFISLSLFFCRWQSFFFEEERSGRSRSSTSTSLRKASPQVVAFVSLSLCSLLTFVLFSPLLLSSLLSSSPLLSSPLFSSLLFSSHHNQEPGDGPRRTSTSPARGTAAAAAATTPTTPLLLPPSLPRPSSGSSGSSRGTSA